MPRERKDAVKKTVAVDAKTYTWVVDYASNKGIDYSAAINVLLSEAKEKIERAQRIEDAREAMYRQVDESLLYVADDPKREVE